MIKALCTPQSVVKCGGAPMDPNTENAFSNEFFDQTTLKLQVVSVIYVLIRV